MTDLHGVESISRGETIDEADGVVALCAGGQVASEQIGRDSLTLVGILDLPVGRQFVDLHTEGSPAGPKGKKLLAAWTFARSTNPT